MLVDELKIYNVELTTKKEYGPKCGGDINLVYRDCDNKDLRISRIRIFINSELEICKTFLEYKEYGCIKTIAKVGLPKMDIYLKDIRFESTYVKNYSDISSNFNIYFKDKPMNGLFELDIEIGYSSDVVTAKLTTF